MNFDQFMNDPSSSSYQSGGSAQPVARGGSVQPAARSTGSFPRAFDSAFEDVKGEVENINRNNGTMTTLLKKTTLDVSRFENAMQDNKVLSQDIKLKMVNLNNLATMESMEDQEMGQQMFIAISGLQRSLESGVKRFSKLMRDGISEIEKQNARKATQLHSDAAGAGALDAEREQEMLLMDVNLDSHEAIIREMREGIQQIESDIMEIASMMKDLAKEVHIQAEEVDAILDQTDAAYGAVDKGVNDLEKATKYQKKAGKKALVLLFIMFCLILLVVIGAIVLIGMSGGGAFLLAFIR